MVRPCHDRKDGEIVATGSLREQTDGFGNCIELGVIAYDLSGFTEPKELKSTVEFAGRRYDRNKWINPPAAIPCREDAYLRYARYGNCGHTRTERQGALTPPKGAIRSEAGGGNAWYLYDFPEYVADRASAGPNAFGVRSIHPPALRLFPTDFHLIFNRGTLKSTEMSSNSTWRTRNEPFANACVCVSLRYSSLVFDVKMLPKPPIGTRFSRLPEP